MIQERIELGLQREISTVGNNVNLVSKWENGHLPVIVGDNVKLV